jgi:4-hydroxy-3-methylbut-2-enyl diphosphate reductase
MKVIVAAKAGFCFGVKRAIEMAESSARDRDGPLYSLGPLIHNPQVVKNLSAKGITKIENINEAAPGSTLIIRSHGVSPSLFERAKELSLRVVDATCPFVTKAQKKARELSEKGYQVVIVGKEEHPEVQAIAGWTGDSAIVAANPQQASQMPWYPEIGVIAQTTQPRENFQGVVDVLANKCDRIQVCDTICSATGERQATARELARQVDVMIVTGGYNSANTQKLTMLCRATGTPTYHVETADQLLPVWFKDAETVGITAGASTPDWIIEEVYRRMMEMDEKNLQEEVQPAEETTASEDQYREETGDDVSTEQMQENMEDAMDVKPIRPGEVVKGTVVQVSDDEVLVDVGAKSEGVIPIKELSCYEVNSPQDVVQVGDEIEVLILKTEDSDGRIILSKERADAEAAWSELEKHLENEEPVKGVIREVVKGGLLVDVGLRAFLPASLVEMGYVEDLSNYVGQEIQAKVIELNRARRKVILSRKAILEEEFNKKRQELLENLQEGDIVKGVVRRLTNFGAFVDIGGIDGLLHISEMAWYRIDHPSDVVNVGDELKVKVLRVDTENEKVSLGLKQVLPNPWDNVEEKYPVDSIVDAKVVRLAPFGAFVQLEPGVEGLVHISHLAEHYVSEPAEIVSEGDEIKVKVLNVDSAEKRIRLSVREASPNNNRQEPKPEREKPKREAKQRVEQPKPQKQEQPAEDQETVSDGATATIGEMVGDIFKNRE